MDCHQYTRPAGHPPLVKVLAERYSHHLGREILPMEEVAVTVGCSQALYVTMQCLVRAGDEVVLLEPFFDLYVGQIRMAGGTPRYVPLKATPGEKKGWALDVAALEEAMGPRTRVLVLNSPHNPTGKVRPRRWRRRQRRRWRRMWQDSSPSSSPLPLPPPRRPRSLVRKRWPRWPPWSRATLK